MVVVYIHTANTATTHTEYTSSYSGPRHKDANVLWRREQTLWGIETVWRVAQVKENRPRTAWISANYDAIIVYVKREWSRSSKDISRYRKTTCF